MNYEPFLSAEGGRLRESAIRKMGAVMSQTTDLVSFAPGYPSEDLFAWDAFREIAAELLSGADGKVLQYGATRGYRPLLEAILGIMRERGIETTLEQLVVTTGSQQGLDLVAAVLCDPGDVLLVELPSYVGAISAFQNLGAELIGVPQASDGVDIAALGATLARLRAAGRRVKAFYTVPNFQNPTGLLVSQAKRDVMVTALNAELAGRLTWAPPRGGFFLWTQLPDGVNATALLPIAQRHGVIYVTGDAFYVDGSGGDFIRLSFSAPSHDRIREGVTRLAAAISEAATASADAQAKSPAHR